MTRILSVLTVALGAFSLQAARPVHRSAAAHGPSAFDKKQFEFYVRHLFVWSPSITVEISGPRPSPIAGFREIDVLASAGKASQVEKFYVSGNGRQIIRGSLYDIANNPFRDQLSKLKTEGHPSYGTPGAPVILAEFSDFQCHFCKEEAKVFRDNLLKEFPTQVRFYFMDYPLEAVHPWAKSGSIAGQCVFKQKADAFWDFHDWIFEHQEEITPVTLKDKVLDWAKSKSLDSQAIAACMESPATEREVDASVTMGRSLEVNSTPTTFVNGRPMVGATPWADLKAVIDFEIGYQEKARNAGENCGCDLSLPKLGVK